MARINVAEGENDGSFLYGLYSIPHFFGVHKKFFIASAAVFCALFVISAALLNKGIVYEYSYHGQVLGVVKDSNQVYDTVKHAKEKLNTPNGARIILNEEKDLEVKRIVSFKYKEEDLDSENDIISNITTLKNVEVKAYNVIVNDMNLGMVSSVDDGKELLNKVRDFYLGDVNRRVFKSISFVEEVSFEEVTTLPDKIIGLEAIYKEITEGATLPTTYQVKKKETMFDIALDFDMQAERLEEINPAVDMNKLQAGDILQVEEHRPLLSLETVEIAEYDADEDFEVIYEESEKYFIDEIIEKIPGKVGVRHVISDVININGMEMDRIELSSDVIKEPVTKVVIRGTKKRPVEIVKGNFIWPASGVITSGFGGRNSPGGIGSTNHKGLDIGVSYGSVYAADGGTVTVAAHLSNGYGKAIKIDHGDGRATFYAHLNDIDVYVGQKVKQGERIAQSGNTGRSTGPHLHFEVHINGIQVDPMKYLK